MDIAGSAELEIGSEFAGLRIADRLGAGGWGVVYRALDLRLGREVALKVMAPYAATDVENRRRFERESKLLAGIDHPHVLPVHRAGEERGRPYFVMRLVRGGSLHDLLKGGARLAPIHAVQLLSQVAAALDELHDRGIIHRDVKPANVLFEGSPWRESIWLADFGLARQVADGSLTATGAVGTFDYMAPEQRRRRDVGPAADVYALGLVLYEALAGHLPDVADRCPPPPFALNDEARAGQLWNVCRKAMALEPVERFASAGALAAAARAASGPDPELPPGVTAQSAPFSLPASLDVGAPSGEPTPRTLPEEVRPTRAATTEVPRPATRRWRIPAVLGAVALVVALVMAAAWPRADHGNPGSSAAPTLSSAPAPPPPASTPAPSTTAAKRSSTSAVVPAPKSPSPSNPVIGRYVVCAADLDLRADAAELSKTTVIGKLRKGEVFEVVRFKEPRWAYGRSPRLGSGWVLWGDGRNEWLKPSCP